MDVTRAQLPDVWLIRPKKLGDHRGFFSETYSKRALLEAGIALEFVQDGHSFSAQRGVVRGLHFQTPPCAQGKLVRVVRGAIFDVAVDLRRGSATFGRHVGAIVSAELWNQVLIPVGFAHGFCTLEPNTEVLYKFTSYYSPAHEKGLYWSDPSLAIEWPIRPDEAIVSDRDMSLPRFSELDYFFE